MLEGIGEWTDLDLDEFFFSSVTPLLTAGVAFLASSSRLMRAEGGGDGLESIIFTEKKIKSRINCHSIIII